MFITEGLDPCLFHLISLSDFQITMEIWRSKLIIEDTTRFETRQTEV